MDKKLHAGRGTVGKVAVAGIKDRKINEVRVKAVKDTTAISLQGFVKDNTKPSAKKYTDESNSYRGMPNHQSVKHGVGQWVDGKAHTNGLESFWANLKRGYHGTFHQLSRKHLFRYVVEFAGRHNVRDEDTIDRMGLLARRMVGRRLRYKELVA